MFDLTLPTALPLRARIAGVQEGKTPYSAPGGKARLKPLEKACAKSLLKLFFKKLVSAKLLIFFIGMQILSNMLFFSNLAQAFGEGLIERGKAGVSVPAQPVSELEEAQTQEVTEREISDLETRLNDIREKLTSIDDQLASLKRELDNVTNEIDRLKEEEAKPKGFLKRITDIFGSRQRNLGKLYTESQDLAYRISALQEERKPLVAGFIAAADELIEKASLRMTSIMDVLREAVANNDTGTREWASKELSDLWQLAEKARESRNEYAPNALTPEQRIIIPTLLSDDPEELLLWSAALKDAAAAERAKVARLEREIRDLEREQRVLEQLLELARQMRRRDEEVGASGVGVEPSLTMLTGDEATKREIEAIKERIAELKVKKQESEENTERFERRASQIDARLERESEDE